MRLTRARYAASLVFAWLTCVARLRRPPLGVLETILEKALAEAQAKGELRPLGVSGWVAKWLSDAAGHPLLTALDAADRGGEGKLINRRDIAIT